MRREMEEKRRKKRHQYVCDNTRPCFGTQLEKSHPTNWFGSTHQDQYQQPNNEVHYFNSQ
jgi:hypothetical protein